MSTSPSPAAFRAAFEHFVLVFTQHGDTTPVYKEAIRQLCRSLVSNSIQPSFKLDLKDLRTTHWLPSPLQYPQVPHFRSDCENLYSCFAKHPFKYILIAENAVRDLYVILELATRGKAAGHEAQPSENLTQTAFRIWESLSPMMTSDRAINEAGNEITLERAKTPPFQIELCMTMSTRLPLRSLTADHMDKLVCTAGVVVQASRPYLKATTLIIRCKDCGFQKALRVNRWRQGVPLPRVCEGNSSTSLSADTGGTGDNKCSLDPFQIVSEVCQYQDTQTLKIQELPDNVPTGDIPRHVSVNVTGALVGLAVPGQRVAIVGTFASVQAQGKGGSSTLRASYIHALGLEALHKNDGQEMDVAMQSDIYTAAEIEAFHLLASDPEIVEKIAASIAPSICGSLGIKKSVACMLFGGSRKQLPDASSVRGDIHILLLGDPSTAKSQVLKYVAKVAPVAIYTSGKGSSAAGLTAALVRDPNGNYALEGGAMVLADSGVVCIDEFDKMRDEDRVAIHEAMEQQTISIAKAGINAVLKTQCAVLAAANPTFGSYDDTKESSDQHNFEATILSRFDCIWLVRDEKAEDRDRAIAKHVFALFSGSQEGAASRAEGPIPTHQLRRFISYCRIKCQPRLSPEAAKRLENFYVEVRDNARTCGKGRQRDQIPITVRQLESLVRLAESFAKMSLAQVAGLAHVDEAIRLFKLSTVATSQSATQSASVLPEDVPRVDAASQAILQRLPLNGRAAKGTILRDLKARNFEAAIVSKALTVLITQGVLAERGDGTVKRVGAPTF